MGIWDTIFDNPMINLLIVLQQALFGNFGLAIVVFTVLMRLATLPLMLRQLHSSRKMQEIGPRVQEIQKKYKDPKRRQEETMKLYREAGVNPIGCLGPMLIQMPIWFALYQVLTLTVGSTPERTAELAHRLYPWSFIQNALPLPTEFLGLDLGRVDRTYILFVLVAATTWLQTKLSLNQSGVVQSPQMQQTNQMMLWMMPLMFAWFTLTVPSGLAMYWVVTNVIGIVMNWFFYGWHKRPLREVFVSPNAATGRRGPRRADVPEGGANPVRSKPRQPRPSSSPAPIDGEGAGEPSTGKRSRDDGAGSKRATDGKPGSQRKDGRGGGRQSAQADGPGPLPGRRRGR